MVRSRPFSDRPFRHRPFGGRSLRVPGCEARGPDPDRPLTPGVEAIRRAITEDIYVAAVMRGDLKTARRFYGSVAVDHLIDQLVAPAPAEGNLSDSGDSPICRGDGADE